MNIAYLIVPILLLIALFDMPSFYYTLLRIIVTGVSGFIIYRNPPYDNKPFLLILFGIIAILFNPLIPVYLTKEIWRPINIMTAACFLSYFVHKIKNQAS